MSSTTATTTTTTHNNMTDEELDRDWKPNGRRPQSCVPRFLIPFLIMRYSAHPSFHVLPTTASTPNVPLGTLHKPARH